MRTNQPYHSVFLDQSLQVLLDDKGLKFTKDDAALKSVALVGALIADTDYARNGLVLAEELWCKDREQIVNTLGTLANAGIPIDPDLEFRVYNLLPPVSSNFLMAALPGMYGGRFKDFVQFPDADLVCVCSVPKMGTTPMHYDYNVGRGFKELTYDSILDFKNCGIYTSVSRMHDDFNIWAEAAFALNAKFIQIRGGTGDEISTNHFEGHEDAAVLIATDHVKYGDFGVVAHAPSLPAYAEHANPETQLGAAILESLG